MRVFNPLKNPRIRTVKEEVYTLKGKVLRETDKAIHFTVFHSSEPEDREDIWFPLSQVKSIHRASKLVSEDDKLVITQWIAQQKGLI